MVPPRFYATIDADSVRPQWMPSGSYLLPATSFYRKGFPAPKLPAGCDVAVDCGGFVATRSWGAYRFTQAEYVGWCRRVPGLRWAAMFDQCCEPVITGSNDGIVRERQAWTARQAELFLERWGHVPWAWVPTLQGWTADDYLRAIDDMRPLIHALRWFYTVRPFIGPFVRGDRSIEASAAFLDNARAFRVGVGTLCARTDTSEVVDIVEAVAEVLPGVPLHLWGVKLAALRDWPGKLPASVASVDSAAWNGRFGRDIDALNAEQRELGMTQREYGYLVRLPKYLDRFAVVARDQRPAGAPRPRIERQLALPW